jgi:cytochrome P450/glutathione S-transferase
MVITNEPDEVRFRRGFTYDRQAPTFVSLGVGGVDEIARWVLDRNGIAYHDEVRAPYIATEVINELTGQVGIGNGPVLVKTDAVLFRTDSVVRYYEGRCPPPLRLIPADDTRQRVFDLYTLFSRDLNDVVQKYLLSRLLPEPALARAVFGRRAPLGDRARWRVFYPFLHGRLSALLNLPAYTAAELFDEIKKAFGRVGALLSDGRRYLVGGDRLTLADVAFTAVAAPMILPEEFGGVCPRVEDIPDDYRRDVFALRETAAGQFVLRVYQEDRPTPVPRSELPAGPTCLTTLKQRFGDWLARRQSGLFGFLQNHAPVLKVPFVRFAVVSRASLVVEALTRDLDFTIEEINSAHMASQKGAFFLGWDRNNPQFDRERDFARACVRMDDLPVVRAIMREEVDKVIAANTRFGKLDVADTLCRPAYVRLIDRYFGVAGPNDRVMMAWIRILFYDLFLNLTRNKKVHERAVKAGVERAEWVRQIILERMRALDASGELPDNVLNRMIRLSRQPEYQWVDEDVINRNIGGIISGVLETSNKAVIYSLSVLLDRPDMLKRAVEAAVTRRETKVDEEITMAKDPMYGFVAECLRFMPVQPGVFRFAERQQMLTGGSTRSYTIRPRTKLLCLTAAAMRDPADFPDPGIFDPTRAAAGAPYKNWGFALHECFGRYINTVLIPDLVAAVLRLPNLGRDNSLAGHGAGLRAEGGFPNNYVVTFDAPNPFRRDNADGG